MERHRTGRRRSLSESLNRAKTGGQAAAALHELFAGPTAVAARAGSTGVFVCQVEQRRASKLVPLTALHYEGYGL